MIQEQELLHRIALSLLPNVGPVIARALYQHCGSAEAVFREKKSFLAKIPGVGAKRIRKAFGTSVMDVAEKEMRFMQRHKVNALFFNDDQYPRRLQQCPDAPVLLYYKGQADLNAGRFVAIVGTRSATPYGVEITRQLVEGLKNEDVSIVSGLAYGIDITAHEAALKQNLPTIGVTAHGMDRMYPHLHRNTAGKMLKHGGLLTEYPSGTNPDRENFPTRNRIVAGMCDAVVVVEASGKGGALITADLAQGYNRDVFAFPGRTCDVFSKGCNDYIRENKAALITSADDLLWMMGWKDDKVKTKAALQTSLFFDLNPEEERVVQIIRENGDTGIDTISASSGLSFSKLASTLLQLELKGVLRLLPGKRYGLNGLSIIREYHESYH